MHKITGKEIANNIRAERNRVDLTIDTVIEKLGISKPTYVSWEKDAGKISIENLINLSDIFGCSINNFFVHSNLTDS